MKASSFLLRQIISRSSSRQASSSAANIVQGPSVLQTSSVGRPAPSLFCLQGLRSLPYWTQLNNNETVVAYNDPQVTSVVQHLEGAWETIWKEYQTAAEQETLPLSDYVQQTEHSQLHKGFWDWHSYMRKGQIVDPSSSSFHERFPLTATVLNDLRDDGSLFTGTPFGYAFLSTLHAQSNIQPHTSPMNLRLRIHLGLQVPDHGCGISVAGIHRTWQPGKALVLDDSYAHAVWNDSLPDNGKKRVVLLVDIWHPDVSMTERREIQHMFEGAKEKGWIS